MGKNTVLSDEDLLELIKEKKNHIINNHYEIIKRAGDFFLSLIFLPFILPIIMMAALWIKLDSPGPAFYKQKRAGKDGKPFYMYKLRTMTLNSEQDSTATFKNDPRVTKVGKIIRPFSLDELPQVFNILIGDMSFVGPRPQPMDCAEEWKKNGILDVKPGINCVTLLKYRDREDYYPDKIFRFERRYIENLSIENDIFLFFAVLFKFKKILYWILAGFTGLVLIPSLTFWFLH